jgi:hypothetical protein
MLPYSLFRRGNSSGCGWYDEIPDEGFALHFAVADGEARGWFDFTAQHNVTMWRWLIAACFVAEMKRENGQPPSLRLTAQHRRWRFTQW